VTVKAPNLGKRFVLEAGAHPIEDLINDSAKFLGRNYLFGPNELKAQQSGAIELQNKLELDERATEEIVSQMLYSRGIVMTPVDVERKLYEWVAISGPRRMDIPSRAVQMPIEEVLQRATLKMVVSTTIGLKHVNAQAVTNSLRPMLAQQQQTGGLNVGALSGRSIVVTGFADEVARVIKVLQEIDQPGDAPPAGLEERLIERLGKLEARMAALEKRLEPVKDK
jgi:type II secretory pathway component GspD/PulD (secretin)